MFRKKPSIPSDPPTWLIVGLGNPGAEYRGTRHNLGFDAIEKLAANHQIKVQTGRHRAQTGIGRIGRVTALLAKPLTFMNVSGQSVAPLAKHYGIPSSQILVIADDLDLPLGVIRLREKGSAGGHNGHKSIIQSLGTSEYPRIKIGIGADKEQTIEHVLGRFDPEARSRVDEALVAVAGCVEALLNEGYSSAQLIIDRYHKEG